MGWRFSHGLVQCRTLARLATIVGLQFIEFILIVSRLMIIFHVAAQLKKLDYLKAHPKVQVLATVQNDNSTRVFYSHSLFPRFFFHSFIYSFTQYTHLVPVSLYVFYRRVVTVSCWSRYNLKLYLSELLFGTVSNKNDSKKIVSELWMLAAFWSGGRLSLAIVLKGCESERP